MKANKKRHLLHDAFTGRSTGLRQLQHERIKASMPFVEVIGIIMVDACPAPLMCLPVVDNESIINSRSIQTQLLSEFVNGWNDQKPFHGCAFGLLDPEDDQYDAVPLGAIRIQHTNYSNTYAPNGTISDLRRLFFRSQSSLSKQPFVPLLIETDRDRFCWDLYNRKGA